MSKLQRKVHWLRADSLLTLIFVYGYDIDYLPILNSIYGNWED